MSDQEIQSWFDYVLPLVKKAGKIILEAKDINVEYKTAMWDLVTVYDRKVEEILIKDIKAKYPTHSFIGEEESSATGVTPTLTTNPTWIIDPIDGTSNFVRHFPITCISVGLSVDKELVLGIVFNPFMNELYTAIRGKGAYLNGCRITTSKETNIKKSIMNYELSIATDPKLRRSHVARFSKLISQLTGIRSLGSAVLGLCFVATGRMDAYQADGLYPWDLAAGTVILKEAGGHVCNTNNYNVDEFDVLNGFYLGAATKQLAGEILDVEKEADQELGNGSFI